MASTMSFNFAHGDVLLWSVKPGRNFSQVISTIDMSVHDGVRYSHSGLVVTNLGDGSLMHLDMTKRGLTLDPLLPGLFGNRSVLDVRHPAGPRAGTSGFLLYERRDPIRYDRLQMLLAGVAAILRTRGAGQRHRERLWRFIHRVSRELSGGAMPCPHTVRPAHPVPRRALTSCTCAALVDHVFRRAQSCLYVREPGKLDARRLTLLQGLDVLRQIGRGWWNWTGPGEFALLEPDIDDESSVTEDPDGAGGVPPLELVEPDDDDMDAIDIGVAVAECYVLELGAPIGSRARQAVADIDLELRYIVAEIRSEVRRRWGRLQSDGHAAPQQGQPMWPPFMSLHLLLHALRIIPQVQLQRAA